MAWVEIADLKGGKGDKGDTGPMGGFQAGQSAPSNLLNAYGGTYEGSYRVATDGAATATIGSPSGAKAGNVSIWPLGSAAAILVWRNSDDGREWQRSVGSSSTYITDWVETLRKGSKRVAEPLTLAGSATVNSDSDVGVRIPFRVPANVRRWRVYIRNYNDRTTTAYPGSLNFTGVTIGKGAVNAEGRPTGQFAGDKFPVSSSFVSSEAGSQWSSLWQTYELVPGQEYVLSYGYKSPAQNNHASVGGGFLTSGGSAAINTDGHPLTKTQSVPLDVWIAFDVDEHVPQYAYFGDSLTAGVSADLPVYDSWAKRHAHANGAFAQIYAYSGTGYSEWASSLKFGLNKYVTFSGIRKPEVLYNAMGSNGLAGSNVSQMKAQMETSLDTIRQVVCTEIINVTVLPRLNGSDSFEVNRKAWNQYMIDQVPGGALMTVDAAAALTDASGGVLDAKWRESPTNIHLNYAGYAQYANAVARGAGGGGAAIATAATVSTLPGASASNRGLIIFVVSENKPYYSNGTSWSSLSDGPQGDPGPAGPGVPSGGAAFQYIRKNSAGTTTEWATLNPTTIGLGSVNNTPDADKPVSGPQSAALNLKQDKLVKDPEGFYLIGG
ncbi:SGNH/GDSL hydrolase family protein [Arthrobacter sp. MYb213]|uniref:SGNH/GDSL hydrolase family protein n=1 Tax=Arthrobacter sp. MYb213 TaxID=1848595 RepID=UPI000CFB7817|nr:SGNH/GDSL hydrolase family protein [Arthrobacter sp. MYb213]PRB69527.1 hypothetical protein CQ011_12250 [Arthrobacter sp. MYb213]